MALKIKRTGAADYGKYLSMLVAGPPGKGKTRFAVTARNPLLLNAEAGSMSIAGQGIPEIEIDSIETLLTVRNLLALGPDAIKQHLGFEVETVILDTFDEIQRIMVRERLEKEQKDVMAAADWGWLGDQMNAIVRGFRGLDMHVVFTCHIKDLQDGETGDIFKKLDLSGAIGHQLPGAVDLSLLLDDKLVPIKLDNGESEMRRITYLYAAPMPRYDWIKDRSGKLPPRIELAFDGDFQHILDTVFDVELEESEVIEIDLEPAPVEPKNTVQAEPEPQPKTAEESAAQIAQADKAVEEARQARLTEASDRQEETEKVDLSKAQNGDMIEYEGTGYVLNRENKLKAVNNTRFVYIVDGEKILSRNQLEKGVSPVPNPEVNSGIFCQKSGREITAEDANISRIRFRQVLCDEEYEKVNSSRKPSETE